MHPASSAFRPLVLAALLALPAACSSSARDEIVPTGLPAEFMVRSDVPYVRGTIVERWTGGDGAVRIQVRDEPGSQWRVTEAVVTVLPEATLRWSDGRVATAAELTKGRAVMVWATGAELRSSPPQVASNAILLGRR